MPEENKPDEGKTFTQAELDRILDERVKRERSKYADYDELKAKAAKFDELEAGNKTEIQKAADRAAAAERERDEAKAASLRLEIAAEKGVKARYLSGATREELEASADEYLKDHPPAEGGEGGGGGGGGGNSHVPGKPVESLKGGGDPTTETDTETGSTDPAKLAASVPRY
jgi:hypothetical protein